MFIASSSSFSFLFLFEEKEKVCVVAMNSPATVCVRVFLSLMSHIQNLPTSLLWTSASACGHACVCTSVKEREREREERELVEECR